MRLDMPPARIGRPPLTLQTRYLLDCPLPPESVLFGVSETMERVRQQVDRFVHVSVPVLITGEGGTGKEAIARYIHHRSCTGLAPFVKVRCPAVTRDLARPEHEDGTFLSLVQIDRDLKSDRRGTLFLDDVAALEPSSQQILVQLLHEGKIYFASPKWQDPVEVQLICATHRNLEREVQKGLFRRDLFHLINVGKIELPPLRNRAGDIPLIINFLLENYREAFHLDANPIASSTISMLQQYRWPGNIRQLESVIKRYVVLGTENAIRAELLHSDDLLANELDTNGGNWHPVLEPTTNGKISLRAATRDFENRVILKSLEENHWNRRRAARALNISYRALLYKMKESGLA